MVMLQISPARLFHWCRAGGRPQAARLAHWMAQARGIIGRAESLQCLTDAELLGRSRNLQWQARSGIPLTQLAVEGGALVREAARRTLRMEHYSVQLAGGLALLEGCVAEMQTGEGKTLTATLPVFLRALEGRGAHVVTVNDYLARRDAQVTGGVYAALGLSVGCIQAEMPDDERRQAYACDVTYGTASELGFDFLRDRLRRGAGNSDELRSRPFGTGASDGETPVQRGHHFAVVDEADSVLIDEARTPLIIGQNRPNNAPTVALTRWAERAASQLTPQRDFVYEARHRAAWLTDSGCRRVILLGKPSLLAPLDTERIHTAVERALTARLGFQRDRDYVVADDEVVIVDESTGRMMDGRKWQDGLHQAVEAREHLPITAATGQAARVTVQTFFRQYRHLCGMTGTAQPVRRELSKSYGLRVTVIPTHRPCIRQPLPPRVFATLAAKRAAVADEVAQHHAAGRAVLVGTPSVEASEALSALLESQGLSHQVLNARHHAREAQIVLEAGQPGRITIATNMAGRGTDILLHDDVRTAGGLHVIATEMHTAGRIDRQLVGRAGRQGDPGSFRFFLSLEDELLQSLTPAQQETLARQARPDARGELPAGWLGVFRKTQRRLERLHAGQRRNLLRQEQQVAREHALMGLDPYLELTE